MATLAQLETALRNADAAGDMDAARKLAVVVANARKDLATQIPGMDVSGTTPEVPQPSLADQVMGAGETALAMGTGATTGAVGMFGGMLKGLAEQMLSGNFGTPQAADLVEQEAMKGAQMLTYEPRTATGQQYTKNVGEALAQTLPPVIPMIGPAGAVGESLAAARPLATEAAQAGANAARAVGQKVSSGVVQPMTNAARSVVGLEPKAAANEAGAAANQAAYGAHQAAGASATTGAEQRLATAEGLPVKVTMTKGAASRDAAQLGFEKEQMKNAELGGPLRSRAEENNAQILGNFDAMVDATGSESADMAATGHSVLRALSKGYKEAKSQTSKAFETARNSDEAAMAVDAQPIIDFLNTRANGIPSEKVSTAAKNYAVSLGIATKDPDGTLYAKPTSVGLLEDLRREINMATGFDPTDVRMSTILKKKIDEQTLPVAGPLYKTARDMRESQAKLYENRAIVARLIRNRKGMDDPQVAVDQIFRRSVLNGSPDELTFLKKVLVNNGENGKQAWMDLQAETIRHIRDESTKGVGMDSNGNPLVSTARLNQIVDQLDRNGRLDIVLGKKAAQTVRDLNEVARYINTVPPGTIVNNSGTAAALLGAIAEAGATGVTTGIPFPVLSVLRGLRQHIQNERIKAKITAALNPRAKSEP